MSQAQEDAADLVYITQSCCRSSARSKQEFDSTVQKKKIFVHSIAHRIVISHCSKFQMQSFFILAVLRRRV